jgi:peptide deformylase
LPRISWIPPPPAIPQDNSAPSLFKSSDGPYYERMNSIIELGHKTLRKKASPVADVFSPEIASLIDHMVEELQKKKGIGIAAPQIGVSKQVFIVAPEGLSAPYDSLDNGLVVINPTIICKTETVTYEWEGCLSIPGIRGYIPRQCDITITYTNCHGELKKEHYSDFTARIFLHEYDHLMGVMFIDHIENIQTDLITDGFYKMLSEDDA